MLSTRLVEYFYRNINLMGPEIHLRLSKFTWMILADAENWSFTLAAEANDNKSTALTAKKNDGSWWRAVHWRFHLRSA